MDALEAAALALGSVGLRGAQTYHVGGRSCHLSIKVAHAYHIYEQDFPYYDVLILASPYRQEGNPGALEFALKVPQPHLGGTAPYTKNAG